MNSATPTRGAWNVRGENVRIPAGDRRTSIVILDLMIGADWGATVSLHRQKKTGLVMRMPTAADGAPGIRPPPDLLAAMERAAVEAVMADAVAMKHLAPPPRRKPKPHDAAA